MPKVSIINKFRFVGSFLEVNPSISSLPKKSGHGEEDRNDQDENRTDLDDNRLTKMMHVRTERGKKARGGKSKLLVFCSLQRRCECFLLVLAPNAYLRGMAARSKSSNADGRREDRWSQEDNPFNRLKSQHKLFRANTEEELRVWPYIYPLEHGSHRGSVPGISRPKSQENMGKDGHLSDHRIGNQTFAHTNMVEFRCFQEQIVTLFDKIWIDISFHVFGFYGTETLWKR